MLAVMLSFASALNVQKASKDELICIKGIGDKKVAAIMKYRKSHKLKSAQDLLEIKGFGKALVKNIEKDVKSVACGGKKSAKKTTVAKSASKKKESKTKDSKKKDTKKKKTKKKETKKKDTKSKDTKN